MTYLLNIIPFLILAALTGACSARNRRPFGKNLPLSMMMVVFVLFISQMTGGSFRYGFFLITAAAGIGIL